MLKSQQLALSAGKAVPLSLNDVFRYLRTRINLQNVNVFHVMLELHRSVIVQFVCMRNGDNVQIANMCVFCAWVTQASPVEILRCTLFWLFRISYSERVSTRQQKATKNSTRDPVYG